MKAKVKFIPQNVELEIEPDESVMQLAHRNNIFIHTVCNGLPSCTECRVQVVEGEHNCLPPLEKELNLIGSGHFLDGRRLSCQIKCFGDVTVDLSQQIEKQKTKPKPHGSRQRSDETSFALTGNLMDDEDS